MTKKELLEEVEKYLDESEAEMIWYMNTYFTKKEAVRHSDNIWNTIPRSGKIINLLKLKLFISDDEDSNVS